MRTVPLAVPQAAYARRRSWHSATGRPPHGDLHADREQASRNHRAACRLPQRPDDQRRRRADLPDDELPVPRHRARRQPVRAEGARQHLHPHHEPDQRRARAARRRARRRGRGAGARLGPGRLDVLRSTTSARPATISSARPTSTAAPGTCSCTRCSGRWGSRCALSTRPTPRISAARPTPRRAAITPRPCPTRSSKCSRSARSPRSAASWACR